jgi:hypothetical protein
MWQRAAHFLACHVQDRSTAASGLNLARTAACGLALGLALASLPASGVDWSFKAFGTLGGIGTDTDKLGFRRDFTQESNATNAWVGDIDSRLGLQVDADFSPEFHATVQWVARNHEGDYLLQNLDWAFLRWRPRDDLDIRLGRMAFDGFLISEYRNVGYAYLWMRPPVEFYGQIANYNLDGLDITKRFNLGDGYLSVKGYAGHTLQSQAYNIDLDALLFGGNVVYETGDWKFRLGYMREKQLDHGLIKSLGLLGGVLGKQLWPGIQPLVNEWGSVNKLVHYTALGMVYDNGVWPVQAEAAYTDSNFLEFPSILSAYLSVGRRFGKVTPYALYGVAESLNHHTNIPDPVVPLKPLINLKYGYEAIINNKGVDQMSLSLGTRWDVYENIALKAQWSHFWLGEDGNLLWMRLGSPQPKQVNVWSFGVDFVY